MTEKKIQTDEECGFESVFKGIDPVTGFEMYRRHRILISNSYEKKHKVYFEEWLLINGKIYEEHYKQCSYSVVDEGVIKYNIGEVLPDGFLANGTEIKIAGEVDGEGNVITPAIMYNIGEVLPNGFKSNGTHIKYEAHTSYSDWLAQLKPILMSHINATLLAIPFQHENEYKTRP